MCTVKLSRKHLRWRQLAITYTSLIRPLEAQIGCNLVCSVIQAYLFSKGLQSVQPNFSLDRRIHKLT